MTDWGERAILMCMKHEKPDDISLWIEPPSPDDVPEPGYDEWLEAELAQALAEADAGLLVSLSEVKKEFGLE